MLRHIANVNNGSAWTQVSYYADDNGYVYRRTMRRGSPVRWHRVDADEIPDGWDAHSGEPAGFIGAEWEAADAAALEEEWLRP